jgi:hypothetical protein
LAIDHTQVHADSTPLVTIAANETISSRWPTCSLYKAAPVHRPEDIKNRVKRVLATRGLSLYQLSRESARIYGKSSPYFIPEYLYSSLVRGTTRPSIYQFIALSRVSNFRLSDWLGLFGVVLDDIPRLQVFFPRRPSILLDSSVYDENEWVSWLAPRSAGAARSSIAPLSEVLQPAGFARAGDLLSLGARKFLYAKVGREDVFALPDLAPGSICRIDGSKSSSLVSTLTTSPSERIFAVETPSILACGRLRSVGRNRVALCSTFPRAVDLVLGREARILGVVDAEIRPLGTAGQPVVSALGSRRFTAALPVRKVPAPGVGQLIRAARRRVGLSFREASAMSRSIATILGDPAYFLSPGTLSDYDRLSVLPRQAEKILSLCILYCMGFWDFLRAAGIELGSLGRGAVPDELCGRSRGGVPPSADDDAEALVRAGPGFLETLLEEWKEIPLFLRHSLREITGLPHPSLLDFFSVGSDQTTTDPRLVNAQLVAVNRRLKKPVDSPLTPPREPPMYMLVKRDGGYLCGACRLDGSTLTLVRPPARPVYPVEAETRVDAEIIGQITAILRRLPQSI